MMMVKGLLLTLTAATLCSCASVYQDDLVVQTKNGAVAGRERITVGERRPFYSFQGIPFAEPPIGNLRFAAPVPVSNWANVLDATEDRDHCIQGTEPVQGAEDCLFVNIYTPTKPSASCTLLPTMVWIYGGGFEGGHSQYELYGPDHLVEKDVVIVTLNYRLGILGFLSTGDDVLPGNNGLKDQILALKWIKDNIKSFCGNPEEVTIGGQSAGSASVAYLLQTPQTAGLYKRAILQSGVSLSLWAFSRRREQVLSKLAQEMGLNNASTSTFIADLRSLDVIDLQSRGAPVITSVLLDNNPREGFPLAPTTEPDVPGAVIREKSHVLLSQGNFNKVPIMIGFNSLEGAYNFELAFRLFLVQFDRDPYKLNPIDMNIDTSKEKTAGQEIKSKYFGWVPISLSNMELMKYLSDDQFARPIREFARQYQKHVSDVYFYRFSYEGGLWGFQNRSNPGVTHSEELGYYWVSPHQPLRDHDLTVRSRMVQMWTNFIKYGNPTPSAEPILQSVTWPKLGTQLNYLDIGEDLVVSQSPQKDIMDFWDSFYTKYGTPPYATY